MVAVSFEDITPEQEALFRRLRRKEVIRSRIWGPHLHPSPGEYVNRARFYIETLEEFVSKEERQELEALRAASADLSNDYPYWWDEIFRENLRATFLTAACSYVEVALAELCADAALVVNDERDRPKRSIVSESRRYLRSLGFEAPEERVWGDLRALYAVRNCLIHNDGRIWESSKREQRSIRGLLAKEVDLEEEHDQLDLGEAFSDHILDVLAAFFAPTNRKFADLCDRSESTVHTD